MSRLQEKFKKDIVPELLKKHEYANIMDVPKVKKVTINVGVGEATENRASLDNARKEIETVTGQHAVITHAKKSISNFKLRKGMPIGAMTTLRGEKMYEFIDRLISIVLPRIRDFNGIPSNGFDGRGNYTLGLKEQIVFPEIDYDKVDKVRGLNITFVTTAKTDEEGYSLLKALGMPFAQK